VGGASALFSLCIGTFWARAGLSLPAFTMPFNLSTLLVLTALKGTALPEAGAGTGWRGGLFVLDAALFPAASASDAITEIPGSECFRVGLLGGVSSAGRNATSIGLDHAGDHVGCFNAALRAVASGVSQVFFVEPYGAGVCVVLAFALCSPLGALQALLGSATGLLTGWAMGGSADLLARGIFGFNGVIAAMAIGGVFLRYGWRSVLASIVGAMIATALQHALRFNFSAQGLPSLTLPFCLAAYLVLIALAGAEWPERISVQDAATAEIGLLPRSPPLGQRQSMIADTHALEQNSIHEPTNVSLETAPSAPFQSSEPRDACSADIAIARKYSPSAGKTAEEYPRLVDFSPNTLHVQVNDPAGTEAGAADQPRRAASVASASPSLLLQLARHLHPRIAAERAGCSNEPTP
jgi:hypothetical protein